MKFVSHLTTSMPLLTLLAGCSAGPDQGTDSTSANALSSASSINGTWALEGDNQLPYTSFQLLEGEGEGQHYFATGLCAAASWGVDCTQAAAYSGSWRVEGSTLTFSGDIRASFNVASTSERLHLTDEAGHESEYQRESTAKHFAQGQVCADTYGNPLGTCDGGDSWVCAYDDPASSNAKVCQPDG
jgi:hypothetical protein